MIHFAQGRFHPLGEHDGLLKRRRIGFFKRRHMRVRSDHQMTAGIRERVQQDEIPLGAQQHVIGFIVRIRIRRLGYFAKNAALIFSN